MNEMIKMMIERRSIRKYKPDMPSISDIEKVVESGLYAPSGKGKQSSIVIVVTDKTLRDELSAENSVIGGWGNDFDPFYGAPVVIVVLGKKESPHRIYDGSLTMGNMMNAAYALGLGSCWIHRAKETFEKEKYKNLLKKLGIEEEYEGIGYCIIGYPDCENPKPVERKNNRLFFITQK